MKLGVNALLVIVILALLLPLGSDANSRGRRRLLPFRRKQRMRSYCEPSRQIKPRIVSFKQKQEAAAALESLGAVLRRRDKEIIAFHIHLRDIDEAALAPLRDLTDLERVNFAGAKFKGKALKFLKDHNKLLSLGIVAPEFEGKHLKRLRGLPSLKGIKFSRVSFSANDCRHLKAFPVSSQPLAYSFEVIFAATSMVFSRDGISNWRRIRSRK